MRVGNFSIIIPEGRERDSGYVEVPHGTVYRIRLMNHDHSRRCDAVLQVDGKDLGAYRVDQRGDVVLERSASDHGKFTFFLADSAEGQQAGAGEVSRDDRGLVRVVFRPEKAVRRVRSAGPCGQSAHPSHSQWGSTPDAYYGEKWEKTAGNILGAQGHVELQSFNCAEPTSKGMGPLERIAAGVTGLTGRSEQTFYTVADLDYDADAEVTIALRLVAAPAVRPVVAVPRSNPVPPPVS